MIWASALSTTTATSAALTELKRAIDQQLDGRRPDLVCVFASSHHSDNYLQIAQRVSTHFSPRASIGCSGAGLVGGGYEKENGPALVLCAAYLPGVELYPFHATDNQYPNADASPDAWTELVGAERDQPTNFVLLANLAGPPAFDPRPLLAGLDFAYPSCTQIGGLASAPEHNALFLDGALHNSGLVGIALQGNLQVDTLVARGCRPIGQPMTASTCEEHLLFQLNDRPASQVLADLYHSLPEADQSRMRHGLLLGVASTELKDELEPKDFLMRNIVHMDHEKGYLGIGDILRPGQTVQFHLRDSEAAEEDLELLLNRYCREAWQPAGALLFTGMGRGQQLFGKANRESNAFFDKVGDVPLTGFFCNGEIGPIGQDTHLHGYTGSFSLFRPLD
jgi:small ligand-binding sensory domain FIST